MPVVGHCETAMEFTYNYLNLLIEILNDFVRIKVLCSL